MTGSKPSGKVWKIMKVLTICLLSMPFLTGAQVASADGTDRLLATMRDLQYNYDVQYADLDTGLQMAYIDEGVGDTVLVFIHGLGSYIPAWRQNVGVLSRRYRCIALDLPGYGKSSKAPHSGKMTYYAKVIIQLMDHLEIQNAYLLGHSMGGQIAVTAAHLHPTRVNGLILAAPAGFEQFSEDQKGWFKNVMTTEGVKNTPIPTIEKNTRSNFYKMPEDAGFMITDRIAMRDAEDFEDYCLAIVRSVHGMLDEPIFELLSEIRQPALVFFGEDDQLIPNPYLNPGPTKGIAESGISQLKQGRLIMLPATGHFLQYERAEQFNQEVLKFISDIK